jgi:OPT family oligopeptide transporter
MKQETLFPPLDLSQPQMTVRALLSGMCLGGMLSLCNLYSGLKIGWGFNMSITAALLSFGLFQGASRLFGTRPWGLLENNTSQTAASAGAAISSAGLVAPIPTLTILTGQQMTWWMLLCWCFSVALLGVVLAVGLRRPMLLVERLTYPNGIATAETLKQIYAHGIDAMIRVRYLLGAAAFACIIRIAAKIGWLPKLAFWGSLPASPSLHSQGIQSFTLKSLSFSLDPSLMLVAVGSLIGLRACLSMLFGAVVAWGLLVPYIVTSGWVKVPQKAIDPWGLVSAPQTGSWYIAIVPWLLWPGVAMMVCSALTSFAFSLCVVWKNARKKKSTKRENTEEAEMMEALSYQDDHAVSWRWFLFAFVGACGLSLFLQMAFFSIHWFVASLGIAISFLLALVAVRVSGETGITPIGSMGKVTQLTFGIVDPGHVTANLMAANVTGGSASQCADLLNDMKTGLLLGASPRYQTIAQLCGLLAGAVVGTAAYLILIPNPKAMLLTNEWPAPAVAKWKAVAEVFRHGFQQMPPGTLLAVGIATGMALLFTLLEYTLPERYRHTIPSSSSIGLAFVLPAAYSISFFLGGLAAALVMRFTPSWGSRFLLVIAAGLIAGESLTGILTTLIR